MQDPFVPVSGMPPVSGVPLPANIQKMVDRAMAMNDFNRWYGKAKIDLKYGVFAGPCPAEIWSRLMALNPQKAQYYRARAIERGLGNLIPA